MAPKGAAARRSGAEIRLLHVSIHMRGLLSNPSWIISAEINHPLDSRPKISARSGEDPLRFQAADVRRPALWAEETPCGGVTLCLHIRKGAHEKNSMAINLTTVNLIENVASFRSGGLRSRQPRNHFRHVDLGHADPR